MLLACDQTKRKVDYYNSMQTNAMSQSNTKVDDARKYPSLLLVTANTIHTTLFNFTTVNKHKEILTANNKLKIKTKYFTTVIPHPIVEIYSFKKNPKRTLQNHIHQDQPSSNTKMGDQILFDSDRGCYLKLALACFLLNSLYQH